MTEFALLIVVVVLVVATDNIIAVRRELVKMNDSLIDLRIVRGLIRFDPDCGCHLCDRAKDYADRV